MEPVAPLLGFGIGHPDLFGRAGQIGLGNAYGADLVVVGVGLLELAQLATLQNQGPTLDGRQAAHHLEAVARSLQHNQILGGGVLLGPALQLAHRHFVEGLLHDGRCRSRPPDGCRRESVRVRVQANHPLDNICFWILCCCVHRFANGYADGRKRVRRLHALRYPGRSPCRCFAPVLIR